MRYRNLTGPLLEALQDRPVVFLRGARQTGKSTLVQWIARHKYPAQYLTLDDPTVLAAARSDPAGFVQGLQGPVILDEVQRVPELFLPIKAEVDRDRKPGRFLLTGSADPLLLPQISEALVGRMEVLTLWPFSQGELENRLEGFVDLLFQEQPDLSGSWQLSLPELAERIVTGGFPEVVSLPVHRRQGWFGSYVTTLLYREVQALSHLERVEALLRLLSLAASRISSIVNYAEFSRSLDLPQSTLKRYWSLLQATFLLQHLPAWSVNLGKRLIKSPKMFLVDTGLAAHLLGLDATALLEQRERLGALLENFVALEILKQIAWSKRRPRLYHFRSAEGKEVDLVLEDPSGRVVGIEVKATATVQSRDFRGLRHLADLLGSRFLRGIVLYTGIHTVPFGKNLLAVPLPALWRLSSRPTAP